MVKPLYFHRLSANTGLSMQPKFSPFLFPNTYCKVFFLFFFVFLIPVNFIIVIKEEIIWGLETVCDQRRNHWLTFARLFSWHLWGEHVNRINFQISFTHQWNSVLYIKSVKVQNFITIYCSIFMKMNKIEN